MNAHTRGPCVFVEFSGIYFFLEFIRLHTRQGIKIQNQHSKQFNDIIKISFKYNYRHINLFYF